MEKNVENWRHAVYSEVMEHKWLVRCLILFFLFLVISPSFHHHNHFGTDPDCHLCMLSLHRSQFILQDTFQLPAPISEKLPLLLQGRDILFSIDRSVLSNRSPPA